MRSSGMPIPPAALPGLAAVRRAVPADAGAYLALVQALADFEKLPAPDAAARERLIADAFADPPRYELWVAALAGEGSERVVAYAVTFTTYSTFLARPTLYLEDLFVFPEHRGDGHGKALLVRLAQICVERGCPRLDWAVLDWNEPSIQFYRSLGAQPMDEWTTFRLTGEALRALGASD